MNNNDLFVCFIHETSFSFYLCKDRRFICLICISHLVTWRNGRFPMNETSSQHRNIRPMCHLQYRSASSTFYYFLPFDNYDVHFMICHSRPSSIRGKIRLFFQCIECIYAHMHMLSNTFPICHGVRTILLLLLQ